MLLTKVIVIKIKAIVALSKNTCSEDYNQKNITRNNNLVGPKTNSLLSPDLKSVINPGQWSHNHTEFCCRDFR